MEINVTALDSAPLSQEDTRPTSYRITIDVQSGEEDPAGYLWGLLVAERLESVLRLYGAGHDLPIADDGDLWGLLVDAGKFGSRLDTVTALVLWRARDTYGKSWGELASALDRPAKGIRTTVERTRLDMAAQGYWRDASGLHREDDPELALALALNRAAELGARRSRRDVEDELNETLRGLGALSEPPAADFPTACTQMHEHDPKTCAPGPEEGAGE